MTAETGRVFARFFRFLFPQPGPAPIRPMRVVSAQRTLVTSTRLSLIAFTLLALLIRLPLLGLPAFQSDEQFYLLVGQRMSEGAIPFVDIWDRKPIGLFLIYRAFFGIPIDPVIGYQLAGLVFSVATALVIERAARLIAPASGARLAGIAYLLYQAVFNVELGQSPVFYNLLVALAGLWTVRMCMHSRDRYLSLRGIGVMLLLGLAIQIKYTVIFEGIAMGLMLLARGKDDGWSVSRLICVCAVWIGFALLPTGLALLAYTRAGYGDAFIQANFLSIFDRRTDHLHAFVNLGKEVLAMLPFLLAVLHAPRHFHRRGGSAPGALAPIRAWAIAAVFGFLIMGTWYDHYLGPVLVPLSILSAPALALASGRGPWYRRLLLGLGIVGAVTVPAFQLREKGNAAQFALVSNRIAQNLHGRCLYVYDGDTALYRTTQACIPTRFAYPSHLNAMNEAHAIGIDPVREVARIMETRPGVVVMREDARPNLANTATARLMAAQLARSYERYAEAKLGTRRYALYRLRPQA